MFNFFKKKKEEKKPVNYIGADMKYGMSIIKSGKDVVIIDARSKEEYDKSHIKNSINIPIEEKEKIQEILKDKEQTILVYSMSGERSKELAAYMAIDGFVNVIDIGKYSEYTGE